MPLTHSFTCGHLAWPEPWPFLDPGACVPLTANPRVRRLLWAPIIPSSHALPPLPWWTQQRSPRLPLPTLLWSQPSILCSPTSQSWVLILRGRETFSVLDTTWGPRWAQPAIPASLDAQEVGSLAERATRPGLGCACMLTPVASRGPGVDGRGGEVPAVSSGDGWLGPSEVAPSEVGRLALLAGTTRE